MSVMPSSQPLVSRPRHIAVIGNCQAQVIARALRDRLSPNTAVSYFFVDAAPHDTESARRELTACDVALVQDIRNFEDSPLREFIPDRAAIVRFPVLRFASLWPFDSLNGLLDKGAQTLAGPDQDDLYFDGLLGRLRRDIPNKDERFAAYRDLRVDGLFKVARVHAIEERRLTRIDEDFDAGIGALILAEFRNRRLFHTTNRPTGELLAMLLEALLRRLGVAARAASAEDLELLGYFQTPVHPLVARDLGVAWVDSTTRYRSGGHSTTWEQFARDYIARYG